MLPSEQSEGVPLLLQADQVGALAMGGGGRSSNTNGRLDMGLPSALVPKASFTMTASQQHSLKQSPAACSWDGSQQAATHAVVLQRFLQSIAATVEGPHLLAIMLQQLSQGVSLQAAGLERLPSARHGAARHGAAHQAGNRLWADSSAQHVQLALLLLHAQLGAALLDRHAVTGRQGLLQHSRRALA